MAFLGPGEDRLAIHELVASYGDAISRHDVEDFAALWAREAVWEHPQVGRSIGRIAIVKTCTKALGDYPLLVFTGVLGALDVIGTRATGRNYTSELVTDLAGATYRVTGRYDDEYVKRGGNWLFMRRSFTVLHSG